MKVGLGFALINPRLGRMTSWRLDLLTHLKTLGFWAALADGSAGELARD
jgi:hypothetical protein